VFITTTLPCPPHPPPRRRVGRRVQPCTNH